MPATLSHPICDVCDEPKPVVVSALPGIPMSVARCMDCLEADAIPYGILVGNTAIIGGMAQAAEWWFEIVDHTLERLGRDRVTFERDVAEAEARIEQDFGRLAAENDANGPETTADWLLHTDPLVRPPRAGLEDHQLWIWNAVAVPPQWQVVGTGAIPPEPRDPRAGE